MDYHIFRADEMPGRSIFVQTYEETRPEAKQWRRSRRCRAAVCAVMDACGANDLRTRSPLKEFGVL